MHNADSLGIVRRQLLTAAYPTSALVLPHRPLRQLLEFTRHSIDDIVNCEITKREVLGYYKLKCDIQRRCEATDLERWWLGFSQITGEPLGRADD